jgi:hypothetical protein
MVRGADSPKSAPRRRLRGTCPNCDAWVSCLDPPTARATLTNGHTPRAAVFQTAVAATPALFEKKGARKMPFVQKHDNPLVERKMRERNMESNLINIFLSPIFLSLSSWPA